MRVHVTRQYLWAPDGIHVRTVEVGEVLEGEAADIALQMGAGKVLDEERSASADTGLGPQAAQAADAAPDGGAKGPRKRR